MPQPILMTMTRRHEAPRQGDGIILRRPVLADGKAIHALIERCPPLDLNSSYAYFLLCSHFAESCVVAEQGGRIIGFLSAYLRPDNLRHLFVWQVAVDEAARGCRLATRMLEAVLARSCCEAVDHVETTVSPSNHASRRVFERFAAAHDAPWQEEVFLEQAMFGKECHEDEVMFRIGPFLR